MAIADSCSGDVEPRAAEARSTYSGLASWTPSGRLLWVVIAIVAGIAYLPAITSPLQLDDYLHASMARGSFPAPRAPTELYDFVSDRDRAVLMDRGVLPWWSHPGLTIRFFRPLSSLVLWGSHRLLGEHVLAMHLVSALWWGLAIVAVHALLRGLFSPRVTALATLLFALSPSHAMPLAWLANFEVLVTLAFGALALGRYVRFRDRRRPLDAAWAAGLFTLALLGGEYALCLGGYVVAIELVRRRESVVARASGVLPFALPAAAYLYVRARLGCGAIGSGFYSDPIREPWVFLHKAPFRLAALLDDVWLSFGAETWTRGTPRWIAWALLAAGLALVVVPIRRALAALAEGARRDALWLLLGSLLSLAPLLAVRPATRVLGAAAVGVAATVALVIDHALFPAAREPRRGGAELASIVATGLAFLHLVHAPIVSFVQGLDAHQTGRDFAAHLAAMRAAVPPERREDVVMVRGLAEMFFAPFALREDHAFPRRWRVLGQTGHALLKRLDDRSFDLAVAQDDCLTSSGPDDLFRDEHAPVRAGKLVVLPGVRIVVLEANERGATRVRFTYDAPLESAAGVWLHETPLGFERIEHLPKIGFAVPLE